MRQYLKENITLFRGSFALMQKAIKTDDIDAFMASDDALVL